MDLKKIMNAGGAFLMIFLLIGCASVKTAVQSSALSQPSCRIAVLPFKGDPDLSEEISSSLVAELVNRGFMVVERGELIKVINEQSLQYTGAVDPATLIENGRLCGVDFIVIGSVSTRMVVPPFDWVLGTGGFVMQVDSVHVRWVSVRSGQIVAAVRYRNGRFGRLESIAARIVSSIDGAIRSMPAQPTAIARSLLPEA